MPEKIRSVFVMSRDKELTYPEIASILGISQKTVEYRMTKALALFRVALRRLFAFSIFVLLMLGYIKFWCYIIIWKN